MTRLAGAAPRLALGLAGIALVATLLALLPAWIAPLLPRDAAAAEAAFTLAIFGPMILLGIAGHRLTRVRPTPGGRRRASAMATGAALGLGGLLLAIGYAAIAGTLVMAEGAAGPLLLLGLPTVAVQVLGEEAFFRRWLQPLAASVVGMPAAIVLVAAIFAALHLLAGAAGATALLNLFLGGTLFGLLAARDGGIAGACAAHGAWNAGEQLLFGIDPNPGVGAFGAILDWDLAGAAAWGGSDQGLNASSAMSIALAALIAPLLLRQRRSAA